MAEARGKRALRFTGILLIANVIVSVVMLFFPMNLRGSVGSISDIMHVVFGSVTTLVFLFTVGFGAAVNGKRFRIYSIRTILILILFAALTAVASTRMAAGFPTPWAGNLRTLIRL